MALLEVRDLRTYFRTDDGIVKAVDGVSFTVEKGQTLGIVGESGSGKSVTCLTIMGLNSTPRTRSRAARRCSRARTCSRWRRAELRAIRGNDIALIFQDPMTSLNPVKTIGWQLIEAVLLHNDVTTRSRGPARSSSSRRSASRARSGGSTTTRTSSRAACASA